MKVSALNTFPARYKYQITAQFPKFHNLDMKAEVEVPLETKHENMVTIVTYFHGIFNRREQKLDRKQGREKPTTSDQQFIDRSDESPKPPRKRLKKGM